MLPPKRPRRHPTIFPEGSPSQGPQFEKCEMPYVPMGFGISNLSMRTPIVDVLGKWSRPRRPNDCPKKFPKGLPDKVNNSKSLKLLQTESPDLDKNIKQEKRKLEDSPIANEMSKKNKTQSNETKPFAVTQTQEQNLHEKDDPDAFSTLSNNKDEKNKIEDKEEGKNLSTKINENKSKESRDTKSTIGKKLENNPILPSTELYSLL